MKDIELTDHRAKIIAHMRDLKAAKDAIEADIREAEDMLLSDLGLTREEIAEGGETLKIGNMLQIVPAERVSLVQSKVAPIVEEHPELIGTALKYEYKLISKEFADEEILLPAVKRTKVKPSFRLTKSN